MLKRFETYQDGVLIDVQEIEVPDVEPQPVDAETVIASVAAMTAQQKAELRTALGL